MKPDLRRARRQRPAFSLLELMVALAIAVGLAAYAVPSYWAYTARGHRMEAVFALYRAAQFIEAHWPVRTMGERTVALPADLDRSPSEGLAVYRLRAVPADDWNGGYAVEAEPVATGPMRHDHCGTFVLEATGRRANRAPVGHAAPQADCWLAK